MISTGAVPRRKPTGSGSQGAAHLGSTMGGSTKSGIACRSSAPSSQRPRTAENWQDITGYVQLTMAATQPQLHQRTTSTAPRPLRAVAHCAAPVALAADTQVVSASL
jgi:hypothetical protein